jgi:hypothetical protein
MRTFFEFIENETFIDRLATQLVNTRADVNALCEETLELAQCGALNEELVTELWRNALAGLSNVAQGAAGLGGLGRFAGKKLGSVASAAGRGIGNAASAVGQQIGNAASAAGNVASAAGQKIGNAASAVGGAVNQQYQAGKQAVGQQMQQAGQYMSQSKQGEQLKQAGNAVKGLQQQLASMGIPQEWLQGTLAPLIQAIEKETQGNANLGYKVGKDAGAYQNGGVTAPSVAAAGA